MKNIDETQQDIHLPQDKNYTFDNYLIAVWLKKNTFQFNFELVDGS